MLRSSYPLRADGTVPGRRGRRSFVAGEALSLGHGGVTAAAAATGMARADHRGMADLKAGRDDLGGRGPASAAAVARAPWTHQPGLLGGAESLIASAIRGDPSIAAALGEPQPAHLAEALRRARLRVSHNVVGRSAARPGLQLQANRKTREGRPASRPRRAVRVHQANVSGGARGGRAGDLGRHQEEGAGRRFQERRPRAAPQGPARTGACARLHDPGAWARPRPTASTTSPPTRAGSASASTTTPPPSRSRASAAGGSGWAAHAIPRPRRLLITADCGGSNGPRAPVEARTAEPRQRDRPGHHRRPSPARHQQVEPDRASHCSPSSPRTGAASRWSATRSSSS